MAETLAEAVAHERVEFDELHRRYNPVLQLVNVLLGVVPYCDRYLEIWQPGFRTYNLMVPNFLNLPGNLLGAGAPKDLVGLSLYASSRAAECAYCSAHTCTFALRRGSSADAVTGAGRNAEEAAVVAVAEALSTDPHHYTPELGEQLAAVLSDGDAEWIVMGVAMMGFLNKFMDAVGVELEPEAVTDVTALIGPTGWSVGQHAWAGTDGYPEPGDAPPPLPPKDSLKTMLTVVRNGPGAVRLDRAWTRGLPNDAPGQQQVLLERYGHADQVLGHMRHQKPRRGLAAMLRHNLDPDQSELGLGTKALTGLVFAGHVENPYLVDRAVELAVHHGVAEEVIEAARGFFPGSTAAEVLDERTAAALSVARLISPSPAVMDRETVALASEHLSPAEIVELAVWVSVNQLLHRLSIFYGLI
ncbi:MAG: hypothetical protein AAGA65_14060 [Actinomycetota bacterium]